MATLPGFGITVPDYNPGTTFDGTNWSGIDSTATNPLWNPTTAKPATDTNKDIGPSAEDSYWAQRAKDEAAAREADLNRQRTSAYDTLYSMFKTWGIDMDGKGLAAEVKNWIWSDKSSDEVVMLFRQSKAYNDRFTGMADLVKKGQFMSEAEYISQERSYRNVMTQWGLPETFYDSPSDYGRFIANGVSVKELDDRINSAKTFLDNTDTTYKDALRELYGVTEGGMLAYVLDGDKAQSILTTQFKNAAFMGSAESKGGFDLNADNVAKYATTLGDQFNSIGADQLNALGQQMSSLGEVARNQESLAFIDNEDYTKTDTLDAEILNDSSKRSASEKRALREKARFSGSSGFGRGSFSRGSGV